MADGDGISSKTCRKCKLVKALTHFSGNKLRKDGRNGTCLECDRERQKLWRAENLEAARLADRQRAVRNPGRTTKNSRKWRLANPEKERASQKKYRDGNPDKTAESTKKYREKIAIERPGLAFPDAKKCAQCGIQKSRDAFHANNGARDGLCGKCKVCQCANAVAWLAKNPERAAATRKIYYAENKETITERNYVYRQANPEKAKERQTAWKKRNPGKVILLGKVARNRRRSRRLGAVGSHTPADIQALYDKQRGRCACCRKKLFNSFHVDHIVALCNGGGNGPHDLQILCQACNQRKHAKDPILFMQENGFLI